MTNKERYKQAFSVLHTSGKIDLEVERMEATKRKQRGRLAIAIALACIVLIGGGGTAYATDFGGLQRTIQLWIQGDQTDATINFNKEGSYDMSYQNKDGETEERGGGGIAIDADGTERPLTQEELLEELNAPDVEYEEDGKVMVYYYDQKIDITDKFKDGICYVKVSNGEETLYMTIKYKGGYSTSPHKYMEP